MKVATAQVIKMPRATPGTAGYKWTDAQRKKHAATCARKKAARLAQERQERRTAREARRGAPLPQTAGIAARRLPGDPPAGRKSKPGTEERTDAIVYLARAYAAYEGIPDETLLGLLALRTLQGRIK
jgi:hypothetical protein